MPSRRSYLVGAGALLAATAGCVSPGDGGDGSTPTGSPTATPDGPPAGDVTVDDIGVRKAVRYESTMGSGGVLAAEGGQYVVASVSADGEVSSSAFAFEVGDDSWEPGLPDTAGGVNRSVARREGGPLDRPQAPDGAYLAFVVPSPLSASRPKITYSDEESRAWPLDDGAQDTLSAPEPRFELENLDVPSGIRQGETLNASMTVTNVSETDGRFLAAVYWPTRGIADDDESHVVDRDVAAGEQESISLAVDTRYTAMEDGPISLRVRGHVSADRTVYVSDTSTPP